MSARTEALVLEGIAKLDDRFDRMLLGQAEETIDGLIAALSPTPGVRSIEPAGSFRRRSESIGDLDLLAETDEPARLIDAFTGLGLVDSVINRGGYKAAVRLMRGPQVDLMVMPPGEAGTYRIHFTGSKEHNVRLRAMARDRGWSLSEKGFLRIGEDGEPLTGDAAELRTFATEAEAYAFLDLPFIEPELREDAGEIEAALAGRLPVLIEQADLRGDLHSHSDWSDGHHPIEVMAEAARRRGYAYQVLTDHSQSLAIARGLTPDRVAEQAEIIAALNARFAAEEAAGTAPPETPAEGFRLLHGCELEVRADGALDFEDDLLARFDLVVASVHVARRQSRAELTRRTLNAIRSPHVDVIAHPSGRKIGQRDDLDLDWDAVYAEAARTGTALEMNGSPPRLDLAVERARRAVAVGCRAVDRFGRARHQGARLRALGDQPGPPGVGRRRRTSSTRGRGPSCWRGPPANGRADRDRSAYDRRHGRPRDRTATSRSSAVTVVGLSRLIDPPLVWLVGRRSCSGRCSSARSRSWPTRPGRRSRFGVPIEALILPSVAAVACLGAIRLVPFGLWLAPALVVTWLIVGAHAGARGAASTGRRRR